VLRTLKAEVWYDAVWYDAVWYDAVWYDAVWYDVAWYDVKLGRFIPWPTHDQVTYLNEIPQILLKKIRLT